MNKKKLLALLMALVMTLTLVPVTAFAEEETKATLTHGGTTIEYTTAQEALDRAVNGDTVTLYTGDHGTLYLRQNNYVSVGVDVRQQEGENWGTNDRYRALNGVTIQGNTGATLERIVFEAGAHYGTTHSNPGYSTTLDSFMEIDNLTISGLTFNITGPAALDFGNAGNLRITGLNVTNCTVNGTGNYGGAERLLYGTLQSEQLTSREDSPLTGVTKTDVDYTTGLSNLSVTNCTFNNLHQVMEIRNVSGLTFTGNTINRTASHALLCVSDSNNPYSLKGTVTVSGNTADHVGDRFFRTNQMKDATVTLTNNTITDSGKESRVNDKDASLVAMDNGDNVTYTVSGNSWNGGTDAQTVGNSALFRADPAVVLTPANVAAVVRNSETIDSYTTLQAAINAAQDGDTIKLLEDVTVSSSTEITKDTTLDLNGHTITSSAVLFNCYGNYNVTIKDSSEGQNGKIDVSAEKIVYMSNGKLTLESGALEVHNTSGSNTYGVQVGSNGTFEMTGGSITIPNTSTTTYNYPVSNSGGTVTISGGDICAKASGGNYAVNSSGGTVNISGGSFEAYAYAAGFKSPYVLYGSGSKTVTGGYFKAVGNEATYNAGHFVDGSGTTISGGYFGGEYYEGLDSKYIADGYTKISTDQSSLERKAGYRYKVVPYVAHVIIGNQYVKSATLADAFAAANAAGTATIEVIANCEITEPLAVNEGKNITLTINDGVTVTAASTAGSNVTSTANGSYLTSQNACGYTLIQNNGTLTINGDGTIDATQIQSITDTDNKGLTQYLINNDGTITIESGTFKMYPAIKSIVLRSKGTAYLNGGTFSAWSAVLNDDGGVMTVNNGTYRGWAYAGNPGGHRYAFGQYGTDSRLIINNGDFKGVHGTLGVSVGHTEVTGGTFETRPITAEMISSGEAPAGVSATTVDKSYYTVYAAGERGVVDITIRGGDFSNAGNRAVLYIGNDNTSGDGGINAAASATITGGTFTQDNDKGVFNVAQNTGGASITGGTYVGDKFNGTSYVANGYSAYQDGDPVGATYTYKIGVVKENQVHQTASDENLQVYTGSKTVVESQDTDHVINVLDSITVNVKPSNVDGVDKKNATKAPAALSNVTEDAMTSIVKAAVDKAPNENGAQTIEVTIQVAKSKGTITDNKAVYEVHPEAVIRTGTGNTVLGTVRLSNDEITGTFSFKLEVTGAGFENGQQVYVTNTHANGTSDVYGPFNVATDGNKQFVEVTGVKKFSEVVVTPAANGAVSFNGASLRRRVRTVNNVATDEVVNTTTDIRFSFSWEKPTNADDIYINSTDGSYFEWRKSGSNQWRKVYITGVIDNTANLVICEVPKGAFGTNIEVKAHLVFETANGYVSVDSGIYTRSITQVATSLAQANPSTVSQKWIDYGNHLLGYLDGGYRLGTYNEYLNG